MKAKIITRHELNPDETRTFFGELLTPKTRILNVYLSGEIDHMGSPGIIIEVIEGEKGAANGM